MVKSYGTVSGDCIYYIYSRKMYVLPVSCGSPAGDGSKMTIEAVEKWWSGASANQNDTRLEEKKQRTNRGPKKDKLVRRRIESDKAEVRGYDSPYRILKPLVCLLPLPSLRPQWIRPLQHS